MPDPDVPTPKRRAGGALAVAAGILLSRIAGLVRERVIAHYLGLSAPAGAFRAALRIPNLLQTLLGEGVLSASFIPVYARLLAEGRAQEAAQVARVIGTLLALVASAIAALGTLAAEPLVALLAPGFDGGARALTVRLVQIMFPGTALLVLSAWCLGVLNSHRRFFLSYVSPVLWNIALIAAAIGAGWRRSGNQLDVAVWLAWGAVLGSGAQLLIQLPAVIRLLRGLSPSLDLDREGVRSTLRAFVPVVIGRGSVQLSAYVDQVLSSFLGASIVAAIANAQTLYLLPVSLFGMAISAAELPEMAGATGAAEERAEHLRTRLESSLRRVVFLVVPSTVAFLALGGPIVALLFETGRFGAHDTEVVWVVLAGSALGLTASTQGRLLASAFYALGDPKPPLHAALVRVSINALLGWLVVMPLRALLDYPLMWSGFGLTAGASVAAWVEYRLLRRWLSERIGAVPSARRLALGALGTAAIAGSLAFGASEFARRLGAHGWQPGAIAIPIFGASYLALMTFAKVPEMQVLLRRFRQRTTR